MVKPSINKLTLLFMCAIVLFLFLMDFIMGNFDVTNYEFDQYSSKALERLTSEYGEKNLPPSKRIKYRQPPLTGHVQTSFFCLAISFAALVMQNLLLICN